MHLELLLPFDEYHCISFIYTFYFAVMKCLRRSRMCLWIIYECKAGRRSQGPCIQQVQQGTVTKYKMRLCPEPGSAAHLSLRQNHEQSSREWSTLIIQIAQTQKTPTKPLSLCIVIPPCHEKKLHSL